jgi:hypothetical protein
MVEWRDKTLNYRRAEWFGEGNAPGLEKCIRQALTQLKTIPDRTIVRDGHAGIVARTKDATGGGLFLHIATETPGEAASVIPTAAPDADALDLRKQAPPDDGEWLDGDAFLFADADPLCMCTSGLQEGAVATFIVRLFEKAKVPPYYRNFFLMKVTDLSAVTLLQREGVKEVEVRASLYKATANYVRRKSQAAGIVGALAKELKNFWNKPDDVTPDSLRIMLSIKLDGRVGGHKAALGEKELADLAEDLIKNVESDDEYVIITKTGKKITPKEIFVRASVPIEASGKTVDRDQAWQQLQLFHHKLRDTGVFEQ